jgi:HEAT repeat protein
MTHRITIVALVTALACSTASIPPATAGEAAKSDTDKLFEAVAAYEFGDDERPLIDVAELVRSSHKNPGQRREIEDRLVKLLETGSPACKRFVCRQLWMGGSARCVPALARLLPDDEFSNDARYALERIADPSAAAALRNALGDCKGKALIGVVNSLGQRRDSSAAAMLVPLLADRDQTVVTAAAWSLGRIGGTEAARALAAARAKSDGRLRRVLDDAYLLCADTLATSGKKLEAAKIYKQMASADQPQRIRIAALYGLLASQPGKADPAAIEAIRQLTQPAEDLLSWMLAGPYAEEGRRGPDLFDVVFPPEKPDARDVKWRAVSAGEDSTVNLAQLLGGEDRAAYLRTTAVSPRQQEAILELGSDDGIKAWLNGKLVHANNASRGLQPGEDQVKITLQSGENTLLLKVTNGSTDWGASARLVGADGKPIAGLKVVAK